MGSHVTPFMISPRPFIRKAIQILNIQPMDAFLDIGSGDGTVLKEVASLPKQPLLLMGIELRKELCEKSKKLVPHAIINEGSWDQYPHVLRASNKVYLFLDMGGVEMISPLLDRYLPPSALIVSCDFPLHTPTGTRLMFLGKRETIGDMDLFLYKTPIIQDE